MCLATSYQPIYTGEVPADIMTSDFIPYMIVIIYHLFSSAICAYILLEYICWLAACQGCATNDIQLSQRGPGLNAPVIRTTRHREISKITIVIIIAEKQKRSREMGLPFCTYNEIGLITFFRFDSAALSGQRGSACRCG